MPRFARVPARGVLRTLSVLWVAGLILGRPAFAGGASPLQLERSRDIPQNGKTLYAAACANCHGSDGRGAPRATVAFDDPLPDFTDCRFATREPDADWLAVVHDGGPARAFARMMPAYGAAMTLDQMSEVLGYVRALCENPDWPRGELNLPRPLVTEKAFPEDELVFSSAIATDTGTMASKIVYEQRLGPRSQFELVAPFTFLERPDGDGARSGGIGDLTVGAKHAVFHDFKRGSIFSVASEIILPIGDETLGLSKGTPVFEPFVSFGQILGADVFVQAQTGIELPFDTDRASREVFWRMAAGRSFSQSQWGRTWSPMVELVAARELKSGATAEWDVVPQMQVTLSTRQHIMASAGVRVPINERSGRTTQIMFYLLWDWFDGPLFGGW